MRAKGQRLLIQMVAGLAKALDFILQCDSGSLKDITLGTDIHVHVEDICVRSVGGGVKAGSEESNRDGVVSGVCQ